MTEQEERGELRTAKERLLNRLYIGLGRERRTVPVSGCAGRAG